jgi:FAD-linked sulfhydryl oxidase
MARRNSLFLLLVGAVATFVCISLFLGGGGDDSGLVPARTSAGRAAPGEGEGAAADPLDLDSLGGVLSGGVIAPKLGNETAKQELGRASWKLLHTMMARFPDEPTADDSLALKSYIALFARLYPCGECAAHFQQLLKKLPPQTSSRTAAAGWACHVHNKVNERLGKDIFDCSKIGDFYDCGCGDDEGSKEGEKGKDKGAEGEDAKKADGEDKAPEVELSKAA